MYARNIIAAAIALLAASLSAGPLPERCEVSLPKTLNASIISAKAASAIPTDRSDAKVSASFAKSLAKSGASGHFWDAWSDRSANVTYAAPNTQSPLGQLGFNERVRIARIEAGFAMIYVEPKAVPYPEISSAAEYKGWVPMSRLLLWNSCPTNDKGIYNKALIAVNVDAMRSGGRPTDIGHRYLNPETRAQGGDIKTDMNFYFVMKTEGDMSLLATSSSMQGTSDQVLYGWVAHDAFTAWNQRSCLEPNWDPDVISDLKGKSVHVFRDAAMKQQTNTFTYGTIQSGFAGVNQYRLPPAALRYPILDADGQSSGIYKCTVFGTAEGGMASAASARNSFILSQNDALRNRKHVNIVLVIDGTSSMKHFYQPVAQALKEGCAYFSRQSYDVHVGAVIYRDHPDGEYVTETWAMSKPDDSGLAAFLESGGKYGIRSVARSMTEALYQGINTALDARAMGYNPQEANLMLVIGDCGNDERDTRISESDLLRKMHDAHFQMMSFQVAFKNQPAYRAFDEQVNSLMYQNIKTWYNGITKVKRTPVEGGFNIESSVPGVEFYAAAGRRPAQDMDMDFGVLRSLIEQQIAKFASTNSRQIDVIVRSPYSLDNINTEHESTIKIENAFLASAMSPEYLEWVKQTNAMIGYTGYTPARDGAGRELWKTVIYISDHEFKDMMKRLSALYQAAKRGNYGDRKPYIDAVKGLLKAMLPDLTDAQMEEMQVEDVMRMVSGLNATTDVLQAGGHPLSKIPSLKEQEYRSIVQRFADRYDRLQRLINQQYDFSTVENGIKYYWIPVEYLP